jgi:Integrase core domain
MRADAFGWPAEESHWRPGDPAGAQPRPRFRRARRPLLDPRPRQQVQRPLFDEVFRSGGTRIVKTPVRAPQANAIAERFLRTVRSECLDWLLILNRRHLEGVLRVYVAHYNAQRPHRALQLCPPEPEGDTRSGGSEIHRRDRLGGLIHEYYRAAA